MMGITFIASLMIAVLTMMSIATGKGALIVTLAMEKNSESNYRS
jgi:hypothetical protein